jgi:hypothetical protein
MCLLLHVICVALNVFVPNE